MQEVQPSFTSQIFLINKRILGHELLYEHRFLLIDEQELDYPSEDAPVSPVEENPDLVDTIFNEISNPNLYNIT